MLCGYRDSLITLYRHTGHRHYLSLAKQQCNIVNSMIESANSSKYQTC